MEEVDPPPVLEVPAIYIKEEPENETEEVYIKEEPFLDGNKASSNQHLPGVPCKTEAKVETHDAHPNSSQNTSALLLNQFGEGGSAFNPSGDAAGDTGISGASNSKQNIEKSFKHSAEKSLQCSKCDYACTTKRNLKIHLLSKHSEVKPYQCSECDYACMKNYLMKRHFLWKHSTEKPF
ncbi:transcriptional repressor CTCFL-like, partial [Hyalella azteca]|uniref:Transcriptional repressor CTCFL-like n=1 Tax=Hyalella azteca TaxID=294128 RepID=A0A8B7P1Z5_HYAAZ